MLFYSTSSSLLWLEKLRNLEEEKSLGKQSRGLGARGDHPLTLNAHGCSHSPSLAPPNSLFIPLSLPATPFRQY